MTPPATQAAARTEKTDGAFALAMMALALLTMWGVRNQPRAPFDPVGAAAIPFWTAAIVFALAALLLVRIALKHATRGDAMSLFTMSDAIDDSYAVETRFPIYAIGLSIAYATLLPLIGFFAASAALMLALGALLSDRSPRSLVFVAVIAASSSAALDFGFRALLIDLP